MWKRSYPKKFEDNVECSGRSYKRWGYTGTFNTTADVLDADGFFGKHDWYIDNTNIVRWNSNDRIPFGDVLLDFCEAGLISQLNLDASNDQREKETDEFWEDFFKRQAS
tara:strand:- start:733 stop:1059 length:327 start_codon:yes stop_codon:yes gene_type:complete